MVIDQSLDDIIRGHVRREAVVVLVVCLQIPADERGSEKWPVVLVDVLVPVRRLQDLRTVALVIVASRARGTGSPIGRYLPSRRVFVRFTRRDGRVTTIETRTIRRFRFR